MIAKDVESVYDRPHRPRLRRPGFSQHQPEEGAAPRAAETVSCAQLHRGIVCVAVPPLAGAAWGAVLRGARRSEGMGLYVQPNAGWPQARRR